MYAYFLSGNKSPFDPTFSLNIKKNHAVFIVRFKRNNRVVVKFLNDRRQLCFCENIDRP